MFKFKRCISLMLVVLTLLLTAFTVPVSALIENPIYINGKRISIPVQPYEVNNSMLVPARAVFENLKCTVTWDEATNTAYIENPMTIITLQLGNKLMRKQDRTDRMNPNGVILEMPIAAEITNGSLFVPVRAIAEAMHAEVLWLNDKEIHINTQYDFIGDFYDGLARVEKDGKFGFIDTNNNLVIPLMYDGAISFSEGLAAVKKEAKWGFIDKTGRVVIDFKYHDAWLFNEDLAAVKMNQKWGFINKRGQEVIPFRFVEALWFSEGLCAVRVNKDWGYIDKDAKLKIAYDFDEASSFVSGKALVKKRGQEYYIDKNGKKVQ